MTFTPGGGLDDEFQRQKDLQKDDVSVDAEFEDAQIFDKIYDLAKYFDPTGGTISAVFDFIKLKSEGKDAKLPTEILSEVLPQDETGALDTTKTPSILSIFESPSVAELGVNFINQLLKKVQGEKVDLTDGMSDEELNKLYKEINNPKDPKTDEKFLEKRADIGEVTQIPKGQGDPTGIRSEQVFGNRSYWENLPKRSKSLFTKAGLTENDAIFFLSNFDKVTRDTAAALQDPDYTSGTFELMKKELLPGFLEEMKEVKGLRPQLDHINQLAAALPLYDGTTFKEREQLNKIVIGEGIYAGHNPANLQYLDLRVHTVKSNYFNDLVGKRGEKFWPNYDLSTFEGKVKAAKEYAAIVKNSYKIVEDANKANLALYKQNLTPEEVTTLLFEINPYTKYTIKDLKAIIKELKGITSARSEANALDLMLTVAEGMTPAEFFKMTGSGPRGQRKLPTIKQLKNAAFDDKFYQPLLDESFNYLE
jgi:hypothetical protein|tara:strand:- start:43 stop:1476 length:1434 start_codon:yes stop_codon:yes gene_type:complete